MQMTMSTHALTRTDSATRGWGIDDDVVRLRQWATLTMYALPEKLTGECLLGASESCTFQLHDPSGRVSRLHARVFRAEGKWLLVDAGSKNGLRADGTRRSEIMLEPGLEIGIGGLTLVAESVLSVALREFLARLLGWSSDRDECVDHALRSIRMSATRRAPLVLYGEGDLVPTARSIHRHTRGFDRPFIVCDPRRQRVRATVRSAENYSRGLEALGAAAGGTLCVRRKRLPADFRALMEALRSPDSQVQLMVCAEVLEDSETHRVMPIVIPPLVSREAELDHIIDEYAEDAMTELKTSRTRFPADDHAWVRKHACTSLPEIEKATLRLVALRASRNISDAAARLGMAPVSLSRWIGHRRLPTGIGQ